MFGRLKDWRRTAIRYDRCAYTFMSAICIAATLIFWLSAHTLMPTHDARSVNTFFRMFNSVRTRSRQELLGRFSASQAIGCNHQKLRDDIARQFREGMDWSNYRQWEVDRIVPLSAARSLAETIKLCHFTNLQPLWKRENLIKGGAWRPVHPVTESI